MTRYLGLWIPTCFMLLTFFPFAAARAEEQKEKKQQVKQLSAEERELIKHMEMLKHLELLREQDVDLLKNLEMFLAE